MKSFPKRLGAFFIALVIAATVFVGTCVMFAGSLFTASAADNAYKYFYQQIASNSIADKFYKAFETLTENGEFKKGKIQYDLVANGVVNRTELAAAADSTDGNKISQAYAMARDAFYMDHPDLFYADIYATSISVGQKNSEFVAYLDSSRALTTYRGDLNSEDAVNAAVQEYESELSKIVSEARAAGGVKEQIEYVNAYISEHTTYGFGTKVEGDYNVDTPKAAFIYTSYGALVNRESVCEGYARAFKAVMDRLGIPCVCVSGYATDDAEKGNYEQHMWNYVEVEGMWYAVDVTFNATSNRGSWLLVGEQYIFPTHTEDGVISSSGYELNYPALKPYDYGKDSDENGMTVLGSYTDTDYGKILEIVVSYEGKGAAKLEEEGKYLAFRQSKSSEDGNVETIVWNDWVNCVAWNEVNGGFKITDTDTSIFVYAVTEFVQFAIVNFSPNESLGMTYPESSEYAGQPYYCGYKSENLTEEDFTVQPTAPYRNNGYMTYIPSPAAVNAYPSNTGDLSVDRTYEITIEYDVSLEFADGFNEDSIYLDFETSRGNDTAKNYAKVENFMWDGDKTISFTFTPSKMYIHNSASYYFIPAGLVGVDSKKAPDPVRYGFQGKSVVCSKVFNDGRLYMMVYGAPALLDDTDVSVTDFKDENGKYYAESQRSQLILVASKPTPSQEHAMDEALKSETGIQDGDIVASSSYEIDLQLCGCVQTVPNGSYMQVAFGFPEGYDPDDAGTTFKIYHYKHDDKGNITGVEEIPVIVTQYGLIARVTSFSPFTIVQVKNTSAAVQSSNTANVYAYVNGGTGGTITANGKSGIAEVTDSITYDIKADAGYTVGCVRLNGKVIDASYYQSGKLTLSKNDIETSNMLEVVFVTEESANYYAAQGIALSFGVNSDFAPSGSNVAGIVIGCIVAVMVLATIGVLIWWFLVGKKKTAAATASAQAKKSTAKKTTSTAAKKTTTTAKKTTAAKSAKKVASTTKKKSK